MQTAMCQVARAACKPLVLCVYRARTGTLSHREQSRAVLARCSTATHMRCHRTWLFPRSLWYSSWYSRASRFRDSRGVSSCSTAAHRGSRGQALSVPEASKRRKNACYLAKPFAKCKRLQSALGQLRQGRNRQGLCAMRAMGGPIFSPRTRTCREQGLACIRFCRWLGSCLQRVQGTDRIRHTVQAPTHCRSAATSWDRTMGRDGHCYRRGITLTVHVAWERVSAHGPVSKRTSIDLAPVGNWALRCHGCGLLHAWCCSNSLLGLLLMRLLATCLAMPVQSHRLRERHGRACLEHLNSSLSRWIESLFDPCDFGFFARGP